MTNSATFIARRPNIDVYLQIPIRLIDVDLKQAMGLVKKLRIYAYDAYMLVCAPADRNAAASTLSLFEGAKALLPTQQVLLLYGPYRRFGSHTSESNVIFDSDLRAHNSEWGLRDLEEVSEVAARAGFALAEIVEMPANNFTLVFKRREGNPAFERTAGKRLLFSIAVGGGGPLNSDVRRTNSELTMAGARGRGDFSEMP